MIVLGAALYELHAFWSNHTLIINNKLINEYYNNPDQFKNLINNSSKSLFILLKQEVIDLGAKYNLEMKLEIAELLAKYYFLYGEHEINDFFEFVSKSLVLPDGFFRSKIFNNLSTCKNVNNFIVDSPTNASFLDNNSNHQKLNKEINSFKNCFNETESYLNPGVVSVPIPVVSNTSTLKEKKSFQNLPLKKNLGTLSLDVDFVDPASTVIEKNSLILSSSKRNKLTPNKADENIVSSPTNFEKHDSSLLINSPCDSKSNNNAISLRKKDIGKNSDSFCKLFGIISRLKNGFASSLVIHQFIYFLILEL